MTSGIFIGTLRRHDLWTEIGNKPPDVLECPLLVIAMGGYILRNRSAHYDIGPTVVDIVEKHVEVRL